MPFAGVCGGMAGQGYAAGDQVGGDGVELRFVFGDVLRDVFACGCECLSCDFGVEVVCCSGEACHGDVFGDVHDAVFYEAVLHDHDDEDFAAVERDKLDLFQSGVCFGGDDEAGAGGEAGEEGACLFEHFLYRAAAVSGGAFDGASVLFAEGADLHEAVDVQAQAVFCREAACGGVRRVQEAEGLKVGHGVSDAGGGKMQAGGS